MTDNTQPEAREFTMSQYASKDDMIGAMRKRIAELESELEAVGAGGVQALSAAPGDVLDEALRERDDAEDFIDALLDEVLGHERPEWSSSYGRADALNDVQERMTALHKPAVDKAWGRLQSAMAAPQQEAQEPVAYAIFAENGNIRLWATEPQHVKRIAAEQGLSLVKLYAAPQAAPAAVAVPDGWKHDCAALLTNDVELWIDNCPHCGKPRAAAPQPPVAEQEPVASVYTMEALVPGAHPKCHVDLLKPLPAGTKLYTHPAPQPAPVAQPAILGPEHKGMRVDYSGLFKQARGALARGIKEPALAEMLRQFQGHMQELGQRWYAGDTAVIDELLQLYCIEQGARAQAKEGAIHE